MNFLNYRRFWASSEAVKPLQFGTQEIRKRGGNGRHPELRRRSVQTTDHTDYTDEGEKERLGDGVSGERFA